ncbi:MAG: hypothetical protein CM15mP12_8890 [Gammaproteobacteria bacterium]|nr:MAG: hypothetical protein CM15mP12_8890 [Gammaproteobacteria bacterium]
MNFCSKCGSARIEKKYQRVTLFPRYICQDCGEIHYSNPNVVTGVLPINDANEILLCRRSIEPGQVSGHSQLDFWKMVKALSKAH